MNWSASKRSDICEILSRCFPPPYPHAPLPQRGEEHEVKEEERRSAGVASYSSSIREKLPGLGPVLFLDVGQDDLHGVRRAAESLAGRIGQLLREFSALLRRASLEHLDVDHRHDCLSLCQFLWWSIDTSPAWAATRAIQALTCG